MIIQHNVQAMNTDRQLGKNIKSFASGMEKLSTGYRVSKAADDAAGLSISEQMRGQVRGLNRGSMNSGEAMNFLQIADGALNEVHDMLHRIKELVVQASDGTKVEADRKAIDYEIQYIKEEINRIDRETEYNTIHVFH